MITITITQLAKEYNTSIKEVKNILVRLGILQADRKTLTNYAINNKLADVQRLPVKGKFYSTNVYNAVDVGLLFAKEFLFEIKE